MICTGLDMTAALALANQGGELCGMRLGICLKEIEAGRLEGQAKLSETESP